MEKRRIEALKIIANAEIHKVLNALDIEFQERYQYLNGPCFLHGSDNNTSFSWHLDKGVYQCFTNNCHRKFGSDVFGLVRGMKNCSFYESVKWLEKFFEGRSLEISQEELNNRKFIREQQKEKEKIIYPQDSVKKLSYHNYLETRGYPRELIESYHIGISANKYKEMSNRVIFPIRDIDGNIIGFSGRTVIKDFKERGIPKWYHSRGLDKTSTLFNIDRAKNYIAETKTAIIVEGPLDVLRLEQAGIHNGVALMGITMSNRQLSLLIQSGATNLIIALDNDRAGQSGSKTIAETAKLFFSLSYAILPRGKDIGDLTAEEVKGIEAFNELWV